MTTAQPGIFALGTRAHTHLELDLLPGIGMAKLLPALRDLRVAGVNLVLGFGAETWRKLAPDDVPIGSAPFAASHGPGGAVPATQHDVWAWVHGHGPDEVLDAARAVTAALEPAATLATERAGFVYKDSRDLTGFIDGTENPAVAEAPEVALVPPGQPGSAGSHVLFMRWVHDLGRFHALPVAEQEGVIGRTKLESLELDDAVMPPTSHVRRVVVEEDGQELEIWRRSVPYGGVGEHGLLFVAFSADPSRFDVMLARMLGLSGDGLSDRLMDFTRPVSGARYFAPSLEALDYALSSP